MISSSIHNFPVNAMVSLFIMAECNPVLYSFYIILAVFLVYMFFIILSLPQLLPYNSSCLPTQLYILSLSQQQQQKEKKHLKKIKAKQQQ